MLRLVVVMAVYIFRKKDFGAIQRPIEIGTRECVLSMLMYFVPAGRVLYAIAIPMAIFNMPGAYTGTRVAMKRGTAFIRSLFYAC
jgi:hypothetical protein